MLKSLKQNKSLILSILVIVLGFYVYNSFFKTDIASFTVDESVRTIGTEIVRTYDNLQSVSLDQKIFSSPAYLNLTDFTVEIPKQAVGRDNPFASIGNN